MTSSSQLELVEATDVEPWAQQLDFQWEKWFEQREPPTEDKVIQVNLGSQGHPKPIFISESLSLTEKEEFIVLIRKYINVFAWNYEDMPGLDPQVAMHHLYIKHETKPVKQQQRQFLRTLWKLLKLKSINSLHVASYGRNNMQIRLLTLFLFLRRMEKIRICIDLPRSQYSVPQRRILIAHHWYHDWQYLQIQKNVASQGIIKLRCIQGMRNILHSRHRWGYTAIPWCPLD